MKKFLVTAVAAMALTAPAWAQADLDADGDGSVTFEEAQAANPDLTTDEFAAMDTDGDGVLSADEVSAAQDAGQLGGGEGADDEAPAADEAPAE